MVSRNSLPIAFDVNTSVACWLGHLEPKLFVNIGLYVAPNRYCAATISNCGASGGFALVTAELIYRI
jgi:hypothetical protein